MAAFTVTAEGSLVNIQVLMAGSTGSRQLDLFLHRGLMTSETFQAAMCALKFETIFSIVIKLPEAPAVRGMAGFTVRAEFHFVFILWRMTVVTTHGNLPEL
jgi:hypothetical protein